MPWRHMLLLVHFWQKTDNRQAVQAHSEVPIRARTPHRRAVQAEVRASGEMHATLRSIRFKQTSSLLAALDDVRKGGMMRLETLIELKL